MSFLISATNKDNTDIKVQKHKIHKQPKRFPSSSASLTNLHHLAQLCQVASDEVEEGELVKVLGPLVAHLHDLVVTLQQRCLAQTFPAAAFIQSLRSLQSHLGVNKEETYFKKSLLKPESNAKMSQLEQFLEQTQMCQNTTASVTCMQKKMILKNIKEYIF